MRKYISLLIILSIILGMETTKTEAQEAPKVDPEAALTIYNFLNPPKDEAIHIEVAESEFQKTEREAAEKKAIHDAWVAQVILENKQKEERSKPKPIIAPVQAKTPPKSHPSVKSDTSNRGRIIALAREYGLNPAPVLLIVEHESGFNHLAVNKGSGACGLFQRLPCSVSFNAEEQIRDGLKYIKSRYGTSENAWDFWQSHRWY